jgi:DeoR/GlpR family transcriptional regulator of sugar metabolism
MNTRTRCMAILDILLKQHQVKVGELAEMFKTSEMTIRRDLNLLAQQYNITRTHGGAVLAQDSVVRLISFDDAKIEHKEAKELISKKAVELLEPRQRIYIDSGSTTRNMINYITDDMRNVVVTNSLTVASVALQHKNLSVIMLGGEMLRIANCSSGIVAEEQISRYQLDIAFLGAAAVGTDGKCYDGYSPEARLKGTIFEVSKKICLMVDSSKFNCYDLHEFCSLKQVDTVITDAGITREARNLLNKYKLEVIIAD